MERREVIFVNFITYLKCLTFLILNVCHFKLMEKHRLSRHVCKGSVSRMYTKILSCSPVNELSIVWPFRFAMARQEPDDLYMSCAATDLDCTHVLHVV